MNRILIYILLFIALNSCKSYSYVKDFSLQPNEQKLEKLIPVSDKELFNTSNIRGDMDSYTEYHGPDKNRLKIARQFEKYVAENLTSSRGEAYGYSLLRINHISISHDYYPLMVLSVFSFGLLNIIGLPAGTITVELDLSMEIVDSKENTLGIYSGIARERSIVAYYYGFSSGKAREKSLYESIESCIHQINKKVEKEFDWIQDSLEKSGMIVYP